MNSRNIESRLSRIETVLKVVQSDQISERAMLLATLLMPAELLELHRRLLASPSAKTVESVLTPKELQEFNARLAAARLAPEQPCTTNSAE